MFLAGGCGGNGTTILYSLEKRDDGTTILMAWVLALAFAIASGWWTGGACPLRFQLSEFYAKPAQLFLRHVVHFHSMQRPRVDWRGW